MSTSRLDRAIEAIDAANTADPNSLVVRGVSRPRALGEGELATDWVKRLSPQASDALLLAARAHHLLRWKVPRTTYPDGRAGYLRWRRDLHEHHARDVGEILAAQGYDGEVVERVQQIIRKRGLGHDPDVQVFEDALCLVFLEAEFEEFAGKHGGDKVVEVLEKTLAKMSEAGKGAALTLTFGDRERALLERALNGGE